jgi:intracellular sulfur oxidation DsrE/DsrF family protein
LPQTGVEDSRQAYAAPNRGTSIRETAMGKYLLIESRDPFSSTAVLGHMELAVALRRSGSDVSLYLVQNGVLPCRSGADGEALHEALAAGVEVLADDYSLRERGIAVDDVARGVRPAAIELVIKRLAESWKVMFL